MSLAPVIFKYPILIEITKFGPQHDKITTISRILCSLDKVLDTDFLLQYSSLVCSTSVRVDIMFELFEELHVFRHEANPGSICLVPRIALSHERTCRAAVWPHQGTATCDAVSAA